MTSSTAPPSASPSAPSAPASDDAVLDAYRSFWAMYLDLGAAPVFDAGAVEARLEELTVGAERDQLFQFLQGNAALRV